MSWCHETCVSLPRLLLAPSRSVSLLTRRKCKSIFHLLLGLGCDHTFAFIVGREYNYASNYCFFFASKEELQYIYVVGQSEYYSHMLEAAESQFTSSKHFSVVRVSCLKHTWPFLKVIIGCAGVRTECLNKQPENSRSDFYELEFFEWELKFLSWSGAGEPSVLKSHLLHFVAYDFMLWSNWTWTEPSLLQGLVYVSEGAACIAAYSKDVKMLTKHTDTR